MLAALFLLSLLYSTTAAQEVNGATVAEQKDNATKGLRGGEEEFIGQITTTPNNNNRQLEDIGWVLPENSFWIPTGGYATSKSNQVRLSTAAAASGRFRNGTPFVFQNAELDVNDSDDPVWFKAGPGSLKSRAGVRPSTALRYAFDNPGTLTLDCTRGAFMMHFYGELEVLGDDEFDKAHNGQLLIGWDHYLSQKKNFNWYGRRSNGEDPQAGFEVIDGEFEAFSPDKFDRLIIGNGYYFEKPMDRSTAAQGWSAIYVGRPTDDTFEFWVHPGGLVTTQFLENYIPTNGPFDGDYLSSVHTFPWVR